MARKSKKESQESQELEVLEPEIKAYPSNDFVDGKEIYTINGKVDVTGSKYEQTITDAKGGVKPEAAQSAYFSDSALDPYEVAHSK